MSENKGGIPVFDAIKYKQASRTIIRPDGTKAVERRPIQKSTRGLDPSGDICWMPLYTGPSQIGEADPYKLDVENSKRKQGWIFPLTECPQNGGYIVQQHLPEETRGRKPCTTGARGGPMDESNPCKCVVETQNARRVEVAARNERIEGLAKTQQQRFYEQQEELLRETREQNRAIVAAVTKDSSKK